MVSFIASRLALACVLGAVSSGCAGVPLLADRPDPARYEGCKDPQGSAELAQAQVDIYAGRDVEALPLLADLVQRCPDLVPAHLLYQNTAMTVGGAAEKTMRTYYKGLSTEGPSVVPTYVAARLFESAYSKYQALEQITHRDSSFYYAHFSLGRLLRSSGRLSDAFDSFSRALALNPNLLPARLELAETLVEWGREAEAVVHYENYLRGAPDDYAAMRAFERLLVYRLGRLDAGLVWIEKLLARDPQDAPAMMDKAAALWRAGRTGEARTIYLDVLTLRPDEARAILDLGYLYYDVLARDDATRLQWWPRAYKAFVLYQREAQPEEGMDYVEELLSVPYRLKAIEEFLRQHGIQVDKVPPTLAELR
jgi:tetratricopeptide (TPR) repeat protein